MYPPVSNRFSSRGIADTWGEVTAQLPPVEALPPAFTAQAVTLSPPIATSGNCREAFRGAVALPDGRVLAIPFCVNRFAVIDPSAPTPTAEWVGPTLTSLRPIGPDQPGSYGGGVLGCDLRVYALPYLTETTVMRITPAEDGGLTFDRLPVSSPGTRQLSGGVVARSCLSGFRIIAAGNGGLFSLEPTEGDVAVTGPLTVAAATGLRFSGVARLGDGRVVSAPALGASGIVTLSVQSSTLTVTSTSTSSGPESWFGVSTRRTSDAFAMNEAGTVTTVFQDATLGASRTMAGARLRWPTSSLTGWVFASGADLLALNETPPPADRVHLTPAVTDTGLYSSGGLVLSANGTLVSVPGVTDRSVITLYTPGAGATMLLPGVVLSPWFNKL